MMTSALSEAFGQRIGRRRRELRVVKLGAVG